VILLKIEPMMPKTNLITQVPQMAGRQAEGGLSRPRLIGLARQKVKALSGY
jgi:hypothetical protein